MYLNRDTTTQKENDMNMPKAVCTLLTKNVNGTIQILAVSRRNDVNVFGLPGGKVDPNESLIAAAKRELFEETGLKAIEIELAYTCVCKGEVDYETTTYIVKDYTGVATTKPNEGVVRWVEPIVLIEGPFGEYNKKLFNATKIQWQP